MKIWSQSFRFKYAFVICAVFAFAFITACSPSQVRTGPRTTSYANLYRIGLAIRQYKFDNGALPMHLSEIVPRNIPLNEIDIFYVTNKLASNQMLPENWNSDPKQIDVSSSYCYIGTNNTRGVIAFERTNLWKPATANADKLAVLFSDFHVEYISTVKVQELIGRTNGQDQP